MRILGITRRNWAIIIGAVVVAMVAPLFVLDRFNTIQFAYVWALAIALIGLNILTGYSGQISLGNGAFMALGRYTTALLVTRAGWPYAATIPVGAVLSGIVGLLVGIPSLRLRGIYLALATFALALSVTPVLNNYDKFTGGHVGVFMHTVKPPFGVPLSNQQWLYFLGWGIFIVTFLPAWLLLRGRTGRAWMAVRDSETAATANGISTAYYKTFAFGLSAAYAGIAGSLLVIDLAYASPDTYSLNLSLQLLIGLVIGGLAYLWGPVVGATLIVWLPIFAEKGFGGKPDLAFGVLLILLVFIAPNGIAGFVHRLFLRATGSSGRQAALAGVMEATPAEADQITT